MASKKSTWYLLSIVHRFYDDSEVRALGVFEHREDAESARRAYSCSRSPGCGRLEITEVYANPDPDENWIDDVVVNARDILDSYDGVHL